MSRADMTTPSPPRWRADDILFGFLQHAAGVALVLTASALVFTDHTRAAASALLPGLLIVMLYGANQIRFQAMLERAVLLVGASTFVAPWMLRFTANDGATWALVALGSVATASAAIWLKIARQS